MSLPTSDDENFSNKNSVVYLGFIDTPVKEEDQITTEDTFIGGEPKWLHPESKPSDELLKCGACKSTDNMRLLLQAFAPLDYEQIEELQKPYGLNNMRYVNPDDDRVLYVFICTKCQHKANSVKCIRGVKKNKPQTTREKLSDKMASLSMNNESSINPFANDNDNSNPFGANPFSSNPVDNPFKEKSTISDKDLKKDKEDGTKVKQVSAKTVKKLHENLQDKVFDSSKTFKSYFLYVDEESFKNKKPDHLKLPKNLKIDKDALELTGESESNLGKDPIKLDPRTEKLSKFLDDETFQKFQEIVGYNPSQVLRYDLGGRPLLYAATDVDLASTVPNPAYNPSSNRIFEMQLMPKMIIDLEEEVSLADSMEWGTIMIFTDLENYVPQFDENDIGYVQECAKIQWESRN